MIILIEPYDRVTVNFFKNIFIIFQILLKSLSFSYQKFLGRKNLGRLCQYGGSFRSLNYSKTSFFEQNFELCKKFREKS